MKQFIGSIAAKSLLTGAVFCASLGCLRADELKQVLVEVAADSENVGYDAWRAMDGDPGTMWHTQFNAPPSAPGAKIGIPIRCGYSQGCVSSHPKPVPVPPGKQNENNVAPPHEIIVDLTSVYEINGIAYQARTDMGNGTIGNFEVYVANPDEPCDEHSGEHSEGACIAQYGKPVAIGTFEKVRTSQRIVFDRPVKGQYVKLVALSELNNQPFTSVAELTVLVDGVKFVAGSDGQTQAAVKRIAMETGLKLGGTKDLVDQYNLIAYEFSRPEFHEAIKDEVFNEQAMILPTDRDPADVVMRRTLALYDDLKANGGVLLYEVAASKDILRGALGRSLLNLLQQQVTATDPQDTEARFGLYLQICELRRTIAFANPLLDFDEILLVKKHRSTFRHMCDQFYGNYTLPGGELCVLSNPFDTETPPETRDLLENSVVQTGRLAGTMLNTGAFLSPDLNYSGDKIAFAYVECEGPTEHLYHTDLSQGHWTPGRSYHVFTCNADGSDLRQITDGQWNDFDPCYLPNGRLAFITERRGGYLRCGRNCPNYTLFDMNEDGGQIRCLNYHETNEWNPSVTNDGKIIYTRWDYIDRFGCITHHPWLTSLDGRDPRSVHGNFSPRHVRPDGEFDCRAIPDSPRYIATAGPHHGLSFGSIIMIDPRVEDDDAMAPVKRVTAQFGFPESQNGGQVIGTPWPLSENYFLAVADFAYQPAAGVKPAHGNGDYGLYLMDAFGNMELIYRDPEISVASPIPFIPRQMPLETMTLLDNDEIPHQPFVPHPSPSLEGRPLGTVTITDVYQSLKPWPKDVKLDKLRVVQIYTMSTPSGGLRPHETGFREVSSPDSVNLTRGVLGTVPIESDGSVHFNVPANCEIFFQVLDEEGLVVQSMRSGTCLHEGETLGCVGCHEPKVNTPTAMQPRMPLALRRPASQLEPDVEGSRPANFPMLVQPVLDEHCVACHAKPESVQDGAMSLAREPYVNKWYTSYNNLVGGGYAFYDYGDALRTTPGEFGARKSKLYKILDEGHYDVKLSDEEMHRIVLWLDLLSNFYGVYEKEGGESQLRGEFAYPTLE